MQGPHKINITAGSTVGASVKQTLQI